MAGFRDLISFQKHKLHDLVVLLPLQLLALNLVQIAVSFKGVIIPLGLQILGITGSPLHDTKECSLTTVVACILLHLSTKIKSLNS